MGGKHAHLHLGVAAAIDNARVLDSLAQHAQRVVQAALCLIQHMCACLNTGTHPLNNKQLSGSQGLCITQSPFFTLSITCMPDMPQEASDLVPANFGQEM